VPAKLQKGGFREEVVTMEPIRSGDAESKNYARGRIFDCAQLLNKCLKKNCVFNFHMSSDKPVEGVITKLSKYTLAETLERLENVIRSKGLTIFARIDHSGEAERVGLKMHDAKLLIFGSPKAGTPLMISSPLLALDLPLKALIWKDKEGRVMVSYNSVTYLTSRYNLPNDLAKNIAGIDPLIETALSE